MHAPLASRWCPVAGLAAVFGLLCEYGATTSGIGWDRPGRWLPDLAVGWVLVACATWIGTRPASAASAPDSRGRAVLLLACGVSWFAGTAWPVALFWHRAVLLHLLFAHPSWRPGTRWRTLAVGSAYLCAVLSSALVNGLVAAGFAIAAAVALAASRARVVAHLWQAIAAAGWAAMLLAGSLTGVTSQLVVNGYLVAVCAVGVAVAAGHVLPPVARVTDLMVEVIEVGAAGIFTLRQALRRAARDPTLDVGLWSPTAKDFLTPEGGPVVPPAVSTRAQTRLDRGGQPFAVLVHDLDPPGIAALADALLAATRLAESHTALQERLRLQVEEVGRSRRRLLVAADDESRRLEDQLRAGPVRRLDALQREAQALAAGVPAPAPALVQAIDHVRGTLEDLDALAGGLHPRDLGAGLAGALAALAARCPLPVTVSGSAISRPDARSAGSRYPAEVESTVYYITAEALANVVKHAAASMVTVTLDDDFYQLRCTITDDGRGGADPLQGSGLQGLLDRVEALGGSMRVTSPSCRGTELAVAVPLAGDVRLRPLTQGPPDLHPTP